MKNNVKYLTEAALITAIISVVVLLSFYLGGILESLFCVIIPVPLVVYTHKYGFKLGLIPAVAILIISLIINPLSSLCFVLPAEILGIIYGSFLAEKKYGIRLVACMVTSFIVSILSMFIFAEMLDYNIIDEVKIIVDYIVKVFHLNISEENYTLVIYNGIPAFIFIIAVFEGFLVNYAASYVLYRLKEIDTFEFSVYGFKVPKILTIIYIIDAIAFFATFNMYPQTQGFLFYLLTIVSNIFFILSFLLIIQGLLGVEVLLLQKFHQKAIIMMLILYILIFIIPILLPILVLFGIYYSLFTKGTM